MDFLDLKSEYKILQRYIEPRIEKVLESGRYLLSSELEEFEVRFSEFVQKGWHSEYRREYECIGVANCTDALELCLQYILGQRRGAPIILCNFGAMPTAVAAKKYSNRIYYVDCNRSMTMDPNKLQKLDSVKNGVVIVVHLFGNPVFMEPIKEYCEMNNHVLIEDSAQAMGVFEENMSDFSCFSFYPTKPLSAMGDGGAILTGNTDAAKKLRELRFYGIGDSGVVEEVGMNSRLSEISAAILNVKLSTGLKRCENLTQKRIKNAVEFGVNIQGINWLPKCVFHQFVVLFNERDKVILPALREAKIPYMIHYPFHLNEIAVLRGQGEVGYRVNDKIVSLPVHSYLTDLDKSKIKDFLWQYRSYEYID